MRELGKLKNILDVKKLTKIVNQRFNRERGRSDAYIFAINSAIPKEQLIHQLVAPYTSKLSTSKPLPPTKSCMNCVIEKLKLK